MSVKSQLALRKQITEVKNLLPEFSKEDRPDILEHIQHLKSQLQPLPKIIIKPSTRIGECGLDSTKKYIMFPLFRMGCCGEDNAVINQIRFEIPNVIDKGFLGCIARYIKKYPLLDWDWVSFRNNIIKPNRDHIQLNMELDEFFMKRVINDLNVCLNDYHKYEGEVFDKDESVPVCHSTFFTHKHLDY